MLNILLIHLAGLASPGPDFFYVVRQSASHSIRAGILAAIGISLGIIFWAAFSIFGLVWLKQHLGDVVQYVIMVVGGSYLLYIGISMLRISDNVTFAKNSENQTALHSLTEIRKGLMINIFNAKAGAYFTSVISGFLGNFSELHLQIELLLLFVISTLIYFCLVALLFSRKTIRQFYSQYSRYIDNAAGVVFAGFGLLLIFEGIQYFTNLETIHIAGISSLKDISAASALTKIKTAYLSSLNISDMSATKNWKQVRLIWIHDNHVTDFSFLKDLPHAGVWGIRSNIVIKVQKAESEHQKSSEDRLKEVEKIVEDNKNK